MHNDSYEWVNYVYQCPDLWKDMNHMILENGKLDIYNVLTSHGADILSTVG